MADFTLDILIRTLAQHEETKQVAKELQDLKDKSADFTRESAKHGEAVKGLESEHRLLHGAMHKVTEESPLLGTALRAALSPEVAPLIIATVAFTVIKKQMEEAAEAAKKAAEEIGRSWGDMAVSVGEARIKVHEASAEFDAWRKKLSEPHEDTFLSQELSKLKSLKAGMEELAKLQGRAPTDATKAEVGAELDLTRKGLRAAELRRAAGEGEAAGAKIKSEDVDRLARITDLARTSTPAAEEAKRRELDKAREDLEAAKKVSPTAFNRDPMAAPQARVDLLEKELALIQAGERRLQQLKDAQEADERLLKEKQEVVERENSVVAQLKAKVLDLENQLKGIGTAEALKGPLAGAAAAGAGAIAAAQGGQKLTDDQRQGVATLADLLRQAGDSQGQINQSMAQFGQAITGNLERFVEMLNQLTQRIENLQSRVANPSTRTQPASG